jgi:BirA family transcriptional regulator, biotin operon repressor / biotin---[acetyl-CoA-carboxylase] ligase
MDIWDRKQLEKSVPFFRANAEALILKKSLPSTMDYLLKHPDHSIQGLCCIVGEQTEGRGRYGRSWVGYPGNIYFSVRWFFPDYLFQEILPTLTLAVTVSLVRALNKEPGLHNLAIKWPNDLYIDRAKVGGVLIQRQGQACVIGVGLNRYAPALEDRVTQGLADYSCASAEELMVILLNALYEMLGFLNQGKAAVLQRYTELREAYALYDTLYSQKHSVKLSNGDLVSGKVLGVNRDWSLLLSDEEGKISPISVGEVQA